MIEFEFGLDTPAYVTVTSRSALAGDVVIRNTVEEAVLVTRRDRLVQHQRALPTRIMDSAGHVILARSPAGPNGSGSAPPSRC